MSYNASALVQLTARQQHDAKALNNLLTLLPLQGKTKMICIFFSKITISVSTNMPSAISNPGNGKESR